MSLNGVNYSVNYVYNGPHTIVSTIPGGYSVTVHGIIINDDKKQNDESKIEDNSHKDLSK
jgi:hypothetical protein